VAFGAVQKLCREQGQEFPVSLKALYKHLRTDGILKVRTQQDGNMTMMKRIGNKTERVMWIPVSELSGPQAEAQQMKMTEVSSAEIPEEWKNDEL